MECPECGFELFQIDTYFTGRPESFSGTVGCGIHYPQSSDYKVLGEIYQCPNHEGFDESGAAEEYLLRIEDTAPDSEEIVCRSALHNGHFHTVDGELAEGYPC